MAPLIAVDLDEVLGSFVAPLCEFHNETYGTSLKLSDFTSYRFCEVWGGNDADATEKVHAFFRSSHFQRLAVIPGAITALSTLRTLGFPLAVVTSRQLIIESETRSWLSQHFPADTFCAVEFGNHWGQAGRKISKKELCERLGARLLIDDSLAYATEVAQAGIPTLLFDLDGSYNWSKSDGPLPERVVRVKGWEQVIEQVRKLLL